MGLRRILIGIYIFALLLDLCPLPIFDPAEAAAGTSVIGTTSNQLSVSSPFQRKAFSANGRIWVFYSNGKDMVLSSSLDGIQWDDPGFPVFADGLADGQDMVFVEAVFEGGTPVPGCSERDPVPGILGIRLIRIVGRHEPGDIGENFSRGGFSRERVDHGFTPRSLDANLLSILGQKFQKVK